MKLDSAGYLAEIENYGRRVPPHPVATAEFLCKIRIHSHSVRVGLVRGRENQLINLLRLRPLGSPRVTDFVSQIDHPKMCVIADWL